MINTIIRISKTKRGKIEIVSVAKPNIVCSSCSLGLVNHFKRWRVTCRCCYPGEYCFGFLKYLPMLVPMLCVKLWNHIYIYIYYYYCCTYIYLPLYINIYIYIYTHIYTYIYIYIYICIYLYFYLYSSLSLTLSPSFSLSVFSLSLYVYIYMYIYIISFCLFICSIVC